MGQQFPQMYGSETLDLRTQNDKVMVLGAGVNIYADRVEVDDDGVWLWKGDEVITHVYLEGHIARRVGVWAEHAGVEVVGI
jgi:hypothetical protein